MRSSGTVNRPFLRVEAVLAIEPEIARRGVSEVARSSRGFLRAYEAAAGDPDALGVDRYSGQAWRDRRDGFVGRHVAQARANAESWWVDGEPTGRHLALIAWAYTPTPARLLRWMQSRPRSNPARTSEYRGREIEHTGGGYVVDGETYPAMRYAMAHVDRHLDGG